MELGQVEVDTAVLVGLLLHAHVDIYPDDPAHTAQDQHHQEELQQFKVPLPLHLQALWVSSLWVCGSPWVSRPVDLVLNTVTLQVS